MLLEHYTLRTADLLAARKTAENPFLTCVLPQALADDLILHCVLALSASHGAAETTDLNLEALYNRHYVQALRQLKRDLDALKGGEESGNLRLLLSALLLATVEVSIRATLQLPWSHD